jgi:hypothetical protein
VVQAPVPEVVTTDAPTTDVATTLP